MGKWKTRKTESSGGIIYRSVDNQIEVALINKGDRKIWCLPKGAIERDETQEETAVREVQEETGLKGEIVEKIDQIEYWFYWKSDQTRYHKTVHFFLLKYLEGTPHSDDIEVEDVLWFSLEEALLKLSYANEVKIMEKVKERIRKEER